MHETLQKGMQKTDLAELLYLSHIIHVYFLIYWVLASPEKGDAI